MQHEMPMLSVADGGTEYVTKSIEMVNKYLCVEFLTKVLHHLHRIGEVACYYITTLARLRHHISCE